MNSPLLARSAVQGSSASSQTIDCATSRSLPYPTAQPLIGAHSKDHPAAAAGTGGTLDSAGIAAAWATTRLPDPATGLILGEHLQGRNFIRDLVSSALRLHGVGCMHLQGSGLGKRQSLRTRFVVFACTGLRRVITLYMSEISHPVHRCFHTKLMYPQATGDTLLMSFVDGSCRTTLTVIC